MASQVAVLSPSPTVISHVEDDDWLLSYLASTAYGSDPRISSATTAGGACRLPPALTHSRRTSESHIGSTATSSNRSLVHGNVVLRVSLPSRTSWHDGDTAVAAGNVSDAAAAGLSSPSATRGARNSADATNLPLPIRSQAVEGADSADVAAAAPPAGISADDCDNALSPLPASLRKLTQRDFVARPRFRPLVAAVKDAEDPKRRSLHGDADDIQEESPSENFYSWVATSECRATEGSSICDENAPISPTLSAPPLVASVASVLSAASATLDPTARASDEIGTRANPIRRGCSHDDTGSVCRMSVSNRRRRDAMDYSELDAVRERLQQAAKLWAVTSQDSQDEGKFSKIAEHFASDDSDEEEEEDDSLESDSPFAVWTAELESPMSQECQESDKVGRLRPSRSQHHHMHLFQPRQKGLGMTRAYSGGALATASSAPDCSVIGQAAMAKPRHGSSRDSGGRAVPSFIAKWIPRS